MGCSFSTVSPRPRPSKHPTATARTVPSRPCPSRVLLRGCRTRAPSTRDMPPQCSDNTETTVTQGANVAKPTAQTLAAWPAEGRLPLADGGLCGHLCGGLVVECPRVVADGRADDELSRRVRAQAELGGRHSLPPDWGWDRGPRWRTRRTRRPRDRGRSA